MLPKFPAHSRVAFIGDSITAANFALPRIIHAYKTVNPTEDIRFYNCGVAGGTAEFAVKSFDADIARYSPTHAVISFGINDSKRDLLAEPRSPERLTALEQAFAVYKRSLSTLVDLLEGIGCNVILCTPPPYDEYTDTEIPSLPGAYSLMLGYSEFVRNLAREKGVHLYDQHNVLSRINAADQIISADHVHPTDHGYFVLAREFLREQGIDIGEEAPIPEYFAEWSGYVSRLRRVLATECMLVRDITLPTEEKLAKMQTMLDTGEYTNPIFEIFLRAYLEDKPNEAMLYDEIHRTYEEQIY